MTGRNEMHAQHQVFAAILFSYSVELPGRRRLGKAERRIRVQGSQQPTLAGILPLQLAPGACGGKLQQRIKWLCLQSSVRRKGSACLSCQGANEEHTWRGGRVVCVIRGVDASLRLRALLWRLLLEERDGCL